MPRAAKVCSTPGCPNLVPRGKCPACRKVDRKRSDKRRPSVSARGYDSAWRRKRKRYLEAFPWCIDCGKPSEVPDHDPVDRAELVKRGDPDPDAWHHLKPRCPRCHNKRTAKQHGGENFEAGRLRRLT